MKKALRLVIVVLVAAAIGGVAYVAFERQAEQQAPLAASGTVEATEVEISAQTAARVTSISVDEGDTVKKGQIIARLDRELLLDQVRQAKAGISAARAAVKATEDDGSNADIAAARAQLRQAVVAYEMARVQLSYATVKAPASGVVLSAPVNAGENATPGTVLAVVADLRTVHVRVYVPEARLGQITLNQKATLTTDGGQSFDGKVTKIASEAEFTPGNIETKEQRVKQVFEVTITLPNSQRTLKPGMPGDVTFE